MRSIQSKKINRGALIHKIGFSLRGRDEVLRVRFLWLGAIGGFHLKPPVVGIMILLQLDTLSGHGH